jgi:hypothetical protein
VDHVFSRVISQPAATLRAEWHQVPPCPMRAFQVN